MDTLTHLTLGAVIGETLLGKSLGKKAMALGAAAQVCPDIDIVASLWLHPADNLLAHRSYTHSLLFIVTGAILFAFAAKRFHKFQTISFSCWLFFFSIQLFIHIFLDTFNAYGVGWLVPFSHDRFSFNTLFVADPVFFLGAGISCIVLLVLAQQNKNRRLIAFAGIALSSFYLTYATINKSIIDNDVQALLSKNKISHTSYITTPTPLNTWLWYVIIEEDKGYYTGYRSVFDDQQELSLEYFPRQDSLLDMYNHEVRQLVKFSQGYYTVESQNDKLVINVLRFGQIAGWHDPRAPFVFYYYLHEEDNTMAMQRGRMTGWNKETIQSLMKRIKGN